MVIPLRVGSQYAFSSFFLIGGYDDFGRMTPPDKLLASKAGTELCYPDTEGLELDAQTITHTRRC
jgi:hypothetical protein